MSSPNPSSPNNAATNKEGPEASEVVKPKRTMNVTVVFLDDSSHTFTVQSKSLGRVLFDKVCKFLNLLEVDYFGLEYEDEKKTKYWLDGLKPLCRQVGLLNTSPTMQFCVKFYTPDPVQLEDEFTRYLFSLQIKKDLASGSLQCNDNTAALMISYIIQADCGDYDPEEFSEHTYLSSCKFVPYQDASLERKIIENYKKHIGQSPAEADLNLLETARRCELYGMKMTPAKDHEGVPLNLAVAHLGVLVFQNYTKINTFSWAKIRKLSFKRKKFLIKLHPEGYGYYKDIVEFFFSGRNECKNFWKKCIENHTFFRCTDAKKGMRQKPKLFSRGSSFRYSGRTQVQVSEYVRENYVKRPFQRSTSLRATDSLSGTMDGSISPQPLLPVSTSLSCGSVSGIDGETSPPMKKLSASEPATPHVTQDITHTLTNGSVKKENTEDIISPGLTTPDSDFYPDGVQSPDFLGQDTDDNISHDSYHVTYKEDTKVKDSEVTNDSYCSKKTENGLNENHENSQNEKSNVEHNNNKLTVFNNSNTSNKLLLEFSPKFNDLSSDSSKQSEHPLQFSEKPKIANGSLITCADIESVRNTGSHTDISEVTFSDKSPIISSKNAQNDSSNSSELRERSSSFSFEQSADSESNYIGENLNSGIESLQSLGISSCSIDSFSPVTESRLSSHKKSPTDKAYFIAKELLMTERSYRKDLEIVNVVFREAFYKQGDMPTEAVESMLIIIDPLYEIHCSFLRELEQRISFWEGKPTKLIQNGIKGVGDIFILHCLKFCELYRAYTENLEHVLEQLNIAIESNQRFAIFYQQFEAHKICYLPVTSFLLRPLYRLFNYCTTLKELMNCYGSNHFDYKNCKDACSDLQDCSNTIENKAPKIINYVKLMELERSLAGFPSLFIKERVFIREGCLQKLSKSGSHQRMFFLFSDILLYTTRVVTAKLHFRVYGCLALTDLKVQEAEPRHGANYCFTIFKDDKCLLLAASSEKERYKWLTDLNEAIKVAKDKGITSTYSSQFSLDNKSESGDVSLDYDAANEEKPVSQNVNTSVHVCWHRNISIGRYDLQVSAKYCISGFLLRKFNTASGWQKLWVVLSSLCLFFYKSYQDDYPLASLPLAGYKVLLPSSDDSITKDNVFKLQYKNHVYFFRAESKYTFDRWIEVTSYSTLMEEENSHL